MFFSLFVFVLLCRKASKLKHQAVKKQGEEIAITSTL